MADAFRRLPGFRRSPAGMERTVLRRLPKVLLLGSLLLALPSLLVRMAGQAAGGDVAVAATAMTVDIFVVALIVLHWTLVLTVAIGAFIVMVMKGPAFVADAYPLEDAQTPATNPAAGRR